MEVLLPHDGGVTKACKVIGCSIDKDSNVSGKKHHNLILDTPLYNMKFLDKSIEKLAVNRITDNLYASVDKYGHPYSALRQIFGHCHKADTIPKDKAFVINQAGKQHHPTTTKGCDLKIEREDQSTSWMPLVDIKEAILVDVAEYTKANRIDKEPAFAWWVLYALKKRDQIISAVHKRVQLPSTKYSICIP